MNRKFRKFLSVALAAALLPFSPVLKSVNEAEAAAAFDDIKGHWAQSEIEYLYNAGMVSGVGDGEFAPNRTVSKAEFVSMLVRALGIEKNIYSVGFSDIAITKDWFAGYVGGAVDAGIIENSVFRFEPDKSITRAETAKMLYNAIKFEGAETKIKEKDINFSDVSSEDEELCAAVRYLASGGIMVGETETLFEADGTLTRAESAAVVTRLSLLAETTGDVPVNISSVKSNGSNTLSQTYSYIELPQTSFHYGLNTVETLVDVSGDDMQLEVWIDSLDTMTGTKLGTIKLTDTEGESKTQTALIDRTIGSHKVYVRLIGSGSVTVDSVNFKESGIDVSFRKYQKVLGINRTNTALSNLKAGGYIVFDNIDFGERCDAVDITMTGSRAGQLIELYFDDNIGAVAETVDSNGSSVTITAPVVSAMGSRSLTLKPATDVDGSITSIRFYNQTSKADMYLGIDSAITELGTTSSKDYDGGLITEPLKDGDIIKFSDVNMGDGYNMLTMRIEDFGVVYPSPLLFAQKGNLAAEMFGITTQNDDAYIEVRADSADGKLLGVLEKDKTEAESSYDTQSCVLYNASGIHDIYLKTVGDIGWRMRYIKFQERGALDAGLVNFEAEDMTMSGATVAGGARAYDYYNSYIEGEASGKAAARIAENGGYVELTVPEYFDGGKDRVAVAVRHCITDAFDSEGTSIGQKGEMSVKVNGEDRKILNSHKHMAKEDTLTLSSECTRDYLIEEGKTDQENGGAYYYFRDARGVIEGDVKPGDKIRFIPKIDDKVTFCYIDCVDLEVIPEKRVQPDGYLSITDCGAVADDGLDDAAALRTAVERVKENPDKYRGIWIPEGNFDMLSSVTFSKGRGHADFSDMRVLGAGMWYSKLQTYKDEVKVATDYAFWLGNSVVRNIFFEGYADVRYGTGNGGAFGGRYGGAIFLNGIWRDIGTVGGWFMDCHGVIENTRVTNTWADGYNFNTCNVSRYGETYDVNEGIIYTGNFIRGTFDDCLAIFVDLRESEGKMISNIIIRNNSTVAHGRAAGIGLWGGNNVRIHNNYIRDGGARSSSIISVQCSQNGAKCPFVTDTWISHNRFEGAGHHADMYRGAFFIVSHQSSGQAFTTDLKDLYLECNEFINNPFAFVSSYGNVNHGIIEPMVRYNYIRNTCIGQQKKYVLGAQVGSEGNIRYYYNVFEGKYDGLKDYDEGTKLENELVGNKPEALWSN